MMISTIKPIRNKWGQLKFKDASHREVPACPGSNSTSGCQCGAGVKVEAEVCSQAVLNCRCFAALSTFGRCFVEKGRIPLSREGDKHGNKLKVWANAGVWLREFDCIFMLAKLN